MRTMRAVVVAALVAGAVGCGSGPSGPEWGEVHYIVWGSSASTVTVAWAPADGATSYVIERGPSEDALVPIATIMAPATSYLDTGLAAQTAYTYRFTINTAAGPTVELAQTASTTDEAILVTGEPTPLGAPVTATVGAAGAAIDVAASGATVVIPADAVPDGTMVSVQPIASPYADDDSPGVVIESAVPFTQPVDLVFGYDDLDAEAPEALSIAVQADDGSWIGQPRVIDPDARTITLTVPVAAPFAATWAGPIRYHAAVRLRATFVFPRKADVDVNKTVSLKPMGLYSDDPCDDPANQTHCVVVVAAGLGAGLIDPRDAFRPARQQMKPLANDKTGYERTWTVNTVINGSTAVGTIATTGDVGATYTAPGAAPSQNPALVRFTSVRVSDTSDRREAVTASPAQLTIKDSGSYRITGDFRMDNTFCAGSTDLIDHFTAAITRAPTGGWQVEAIVNQPTNLTPLSPPPGDVAEVTVEPEVFQVTGGSVTVQAIDNALIVDLTGTYQVGTCIIHHPDGTSDTHMDSPMYSLVEFVVYRDPISVLQTDPWWTFAAEAVIQ